MARGAPAQTDQEEVKLQITPLIDVTFLLLIFFMCAMKFKTLEKKLPFFLPKVRPVEVTAIVEVGPDDPDETELAGIRRMVAALVGEEPKEARQPGANLV